MKIFFYKKEKKEEKKKIEDIFRELDEISDSILKSNQEYLEKLYVRKGE